MFMERDELIYGVKLGRRQINSFLFIIIGIVLGNTLFNNFIPLISHYIFPMSYMQVLTFDTSIFNLVFVLILGVIMWAGTYRKRSIAQEIYPHTNRSRFVSNVFMDYVIIAGIVLSSVINNILMITILPFLAGRNENTVLVGGIMIQDIFIVAIIVMAYGLLLQSLILLIVSCVRKFRLWCFTVVFVMGLWIKQDLNGFVSVALKIWRFFIEEPSLIMLVCKAVVIHVIFLVLSYILDTNTEFYPDIVKKKKLRVVGAVAVVAILIYGVSGTSVSVGDYSEPDIYTEQVEEQEEILIDVSHLEKGSEIQIEMEGSIVLVDEGSQVYYTDKLYVEYVDDLIVDGDTMTLYYYEGCNVENGLDLYEYMEPEFTYELEGNVLKLSYQFNREDVQIFYVRNSIAGKYNPDRLIEDNIFNESGYSPTTLWIDL